MRLQPGPGGFLSPNANFGRHNVTYYRFTHSFTFSCLQYDLNTLVISAVLTIFSLLDEYWNDSNEHYALEHAKSVEYVGAAANVELVEHACAIEYAKSAANARAAEHVWVAANASAAEYGLQHAAWPSFDAGLAAAVLD